MGCTSSSAAAAGHGNASKGLGPDGVPDDRDMAMLQAKLDAMVSPAHKVRKTGHREHIGNIFAEVKALAPEPSKAQELLFPPDIEPLGGGITSSPDRVNAHLGVCVGVCQSIGGRTAQEDRTYVSTAVGGDDRFVLAAVFDGHGGEAVAEYLREHFPARLRDAIADERTYARRMALMTRRESQTGHHAAVAPAAPSQLPGVHATSEALHSAASGLDAGAQGGAQARPVAGHRDVPQTSSMSRPLSVSLSDDTPLLRAGSGEASSASSPLRPLSVDGPLSPLTAVAHSLSHAPATDSTGRISASRAASNFSDVHMTNGATHHDIGDAGAVRPAPGAAFRGKHFQHLADDFAADPVAHALHRGIVPSGASTTTHVRSTPTSSHDAHGASKAHDVQPQPRLSISAAHRADEQLPPAPSTPYLTVDGGCTIKMQKYETSYLPGEPDFRRLLTYVVHQLDSEVLNANATEFHRAGSCAVIATFYGDALVIANVGDCEAWLCRGGRPYELTCPHKADRDSEVLRIRQTGGQVTIWRGQARVAGALQVSRTIGMYILKHEYTGVISDPFVRVAQLLVPHNVARSASFCVPSGGRPHPCAYCTAHAGHEEPDLDLLPERLRSGSGNAFHTIGSASQCQCSKALNAALLDDLRSGTHDDAAHVTLPPSMLARYANNSEGDLPSVGRALTTAPLRAAFEVDGPERHKPAIAMDRRKTGRSKLSAAWHPVNGGEHAPPFLTSGDGGKPPLANVVRASSFAGEHEVRQPSVAAVASEHASPTTRRPLPFGRPVVAPAFVAETPTTTDAGRGAMEHGAGDASLRAAPMRIAETVTSSLSPIHSIMAPDATPLSTQHSLLPSEGKRTLGFDHANAHDNGVDVLPHLRRKSVQNGHADAQHATHHDTASPLDCAHGGAGVVDEFVVLGSDGLFDVFPNRQDLMNRIKKTLRETRNADAACSQIVSEAVDQRKSADNVSMVLIVLNQFGVTTSTARALGGGLGYARRACARKLTSSAHRNLHTAADLQRLARCVSESTVLVGKMAAVAEEARASRRSHVELGPGGLASVTAAAASAYDPQATTSLTKGRQTVTTGSSTVSLASIFRPASLVLSGSLLSAITSASESTARTHATSSTPRAQRSTVSWTTDAAPPALASPAASAADDEGDELDDTAVHIPPGAEGDIFQEPADGTPGSHHGPPASPASSPHSTPVSSPMTAAA